MSIVLITDSTLMLDAGISVTPVANSEEEAQEKAKTIVADIMRNLESDGNGTEDTTVSKTYVNSLITEVTVKPKDDDDDSDFQLDLFLRPTLDIVSTNFIFLVLQKTEITRTKCYLA
eukprot:sb/3476544/